MKYIARILIIFAGFILIWQSVVTIWQMPPYILPSPYRVLVVLGQQYSLITQHAIPTLYETIIGLLLGIFVGTSVGFFIAFYRPLKFWFLPLLIISQAIPTFAIAPLLVIWLGYGSSSKIATTVLMIFFPIASSFYDGLNRTPCGWLDLATTMNAKKWRTFCFIRIPAALPALASGIRLSAVIAPIGAIVGEWVGASEGLGYLMINANARLQIDVMFAVLIVIIMLSLVLYFSIDKFLTLLLPWQDK